VTQGSVDYENYIPIIFIGQNGGYDDIGDLIAQQQAVIDHGTGPEDRYLINGLHTGDARSREELESAMEEAWGDHYINLREYMATDGMKDAGLVATEEDLLRMQEGETPDSLLKDGLHFNDSAEKLIAQLVYKRMDELGWFDEVRDAVNAVE
jgi:siderophore synthetase component